MQQSVGGLVIKALSMVGLRLAGPPSVKLQAEIT
jgi:hypothetical protein